jgi:hypothetical protein
MKTTFIKNIMGIALSVFSLSMAAQCPTVNGVNNTIGSNGSVTLWTNTTGSVSPSQNYYTWQITPSGITSSSSGPQTVIQFPANGTYTVCLSLYDTTNTCPPSQACDVIQINNMNANSCVSGFSYSTDTICSTYFSNNSVGNGLSYEWYDISNGSTLLSTNANPSLNIANGTYLIALIAYSNGQFCDSTSQVVTIACNNNTFTPTPPACQVNASFSLFSDSTNVGNFFAYNTSSGNGQLTYLWDFGDGTTSTQQYPFHQYASPGQYIICLQVTSNINGQTCTSNYCDSSSVGQRTASGFLMSSVSVIANPTSIRELAELKLNAYPNPMSDELIIEIGNKISEKYHYYIVDAVGRIVLQGEIVGETNKINTSQLESGFYNLSITNNKKQNIISVKLLK